MTKRRDVIRLACGTLWVAPIVNVVKLPVHASTSDMNWQFSISFTQNCIGCGWEQGDENGEIYPISPPWREERIFSVSEEDIRNGEFNKVYDQDGNGPVADFFGYNFTITNMSALRFNGLVERSSVDVPHLLRGHYEANKI